jgi:hypothetical protein
VLGLSFDTQAALADDPAQSAIRELTLSLDVPRWIRSEQPFVRLREGPLRWPRAWTACSPTTTASRCRADGHGPIGADLEQLYDTLDARPVGRLAPGAPPVFSDGRQFLVAHGGDPRQTASSARCRIASRATK